MSQSLHCILLFDGTNYGYWKAHMCFFLKSIDVWQIVETGWIKPEATIAELYMAQNSAQLSNDQALHVLCQALSPSEFARISNCESTKEAWQILETTYSQKLDVNFKYTHKCTNSLQLMDCKCEFNPTGNCVF
jgi:hypothetical protein